jgi:adenylate cyclase
MNRRRTLTLGLIVAAAWAVVVVVSPALFESLELHVYDVMMRRAGGGAASGRVSIVAIDDRSLTEIGQWPWRRDVVADLITRMQELGASVVALDAIFAEPDRAAAPASDSAVSSIDQRLASTVGTAPVVLAYAFSFAGGPASPSSCVLRPLDAALVQMPGQPSPIDRLFEASGAVCNLPALASAAKASGYLNAAPDLDGTLRRLPLVMSYQGRVYPSLALAAVRAATAAPRVVLAAGSGHTTRLTFGEREIRLGQRGTMLLRFRGAPTAFRYLSAADLLKGRVGPGVLNDQIVFVGTTAVGTHDVVSTPFQRQFPGIEVHATAADNLLRGDDVSLAADDRAWILIATVLSGLAAAGLVAALGYAWGGVAVGVLAAAMWVAATWLLSAGVFLSPLFPTIAAAAIVAVVVADRYMQRARRADVETQRRRQAHQFMLHTLTSLIEVRDPSTGRHARRTESYSLLLAGGLARRSKFAHYLTADRVQLISSLAPLHDIGKVGIRDALLNKAAKLTEEEMREVQRHPSLGFDMMTKAQSRVGLGAERDQAILQIAKDIVYTHHERWDGRGYPRGLAGDDIPVAGRILAVVDVYDALVEPRPYRGRVPHEVAVTTIVQGRGTQFDPDVIEAFLSVEREFQQQWSRLQTQATTGAESVGV